MSSISPNQRRYALFLLTVVYTLNFLDRQILVILQESIKDEMGLTDTHLGLLTGFAFAAFYVSVGIPIARWADVGNRRNIISLAVAVWSGMTAISGLAQNYWQLLLARIGVGVGEAGGSPPAHSMISDYYPPSQRGTALSIYSIGLYAGILLGFLLGGWINHAFGWRLAFFVVGVPGFAIALLVRFSIKEPIRGESDGKTESSKTTFLETLKVLWGMRSFQFLSIAASLNAFCIYGIGNFMPSYLMRSHEFNSIEVGTSLALIVGFGGAIGTYLGGVLADKLGKRDLRWYLWVSAIPLFLVFPLSLFVFFSSESTPALFVHFFGVAGAAMYLGPTIAITHKLVVPGMRAVASAVLFLIINLIGLGLGPLLIGVASDLLSSSYGIESLRYALALGATQWLIAGGLFLLAAMHLKKDLSRNGLADPQPQSL